MGGASAQFTSIFGRDCILDIVTIATVHREAAALWMAATIYAQKHSRCVFVRHVLLVAMLLTTSRRALGEICNHIDCIESKKVRHDLAWGGRFAHEIGGIVRVLTSMPFTRAVLDAYAFEAHAIDARPAQNLSKLETFILKRLRGEAQRRVLHVWATKTRELPCPVAFCPPAIPPLAEQMMVLYASKPFTWAPMMRYVAADVVDWLSPVMSHCAPPIPEEVRARWTPEYVFNGRRVTHLDLLLMEDEHGRNAWTHYKDLCARGVIEAIFKQ